MKLPSWTVKLAAAAVIPVILGVGVAFSAPSLVSLEEASVDQDWRPGEMGVDYAAVTGSQTSGLDQGRSCDDPTWPLVPVACLSGDDADEVRRARLPK